MPKVALLTLGEDEKAALSDTVDSGWITMADRVRNLERAFAEKRGAKGGASPARRQLISYTR